MKRAIARLVDAAFNLYAPLIHGRTYQVFTTDMVGASRLADAEADTEVWEPEPLADWERELLDAYYMTDDQWAARQRHLRAVTNQPDDPGALPGFVGSQPPAGAGAAMTPPYAAASATSAGGSTPKPDPIATVVAVVLRGQGIQSSAIYGDLIARELRHHFDFQPK